MLQKDLRKASKSFILGIIFGGWGLDGLNDISRSVFHTNERVREGIQIWLEKMWF